MFLFENYWANVFSHLSIVEYEHPSLVDASFLCDFFADYLRYNFCLCLLCVNIDLTDDAFSILCSSFSSLVEDL